MLSKRWRSVIERLGNSLLYTACLAHDQKVHLGNVDQVKKRQSFYDCLMQVSKESKLRCRKPTGCLKASVHNQTGLALLAYL